MLSSLIIFSPELNIFEIPENIFLKHNINSIISCDVADERNRLAILIAQKYKIKSMQIQFGSVNEFDKEWLTNTSEKIAVWGKSDSNNLLNLKHSHFYFFGI
mgnify:CR=1 FL=1